MANLPQQLLLPAASPAFNIAINDLRSLDAESLKPPRNVVVLFEDPPQSLVDDIILVRMGQGEFLLDLLVTLLGPSTQELKPDIAITSCAERYNAPQQHSFSALLEGVSDKLGYTFINHHFRETRERPSMTTFPSAEGRREALQGIMTFDGDLSNTIVLLIDDVTTTGSSLVIAAEVLQEAGASAVIPIALLRSPLEDLLWERNQTKRVLKKHFQDPRDALQWTGATRALKEIALEVIEEQSSSGPSQHPNKAAPSTTKSTSINKIHTLDFGAQITPPPPSCSTRNPTLKHPRRKKKKSPTYHLAKAEPRRRTI